MKKPAKLILVTLATGMLVACGKEMPTVEITDIKVDAADDKNDKIEEIKETDTKTDDTHEQETQNPESAEDIKDETPVSTEKLSKAYADFVESIAEECYTPEELAFATADVNNDGVRELLYAESSVNAAGVYVCFYDNGKIVPVGQFGCYGGIKYVPEEGKIISVMDNMDYIYYDLIEIDENYESNTEQKFAIEPNSDGDGYVYFVDEEEVTEEEYADAFAKIKNMDVRCIDYCDMYMYEWCDFDSSVEVCISELLKNDETSRECRMIIPTEEKAKIIGTWELYSSEVEDDISYAADGDV